MFKVISLLFAIVAIVIFSATESEAYITASPSSVYFFDQEVGGIGSSQSVTVRNNSNEPANGLNIYDNCFGDFDVSNFGCYGNLPPYGSCSMSVRFQPRSVGSHSCSIQISGGGSYESVHISGRGVDRRLSEERDGTQEAASAPEETPAAD